MLAFAPTKIQSSLKTIIRNYAIPVAGRVAQLVTETIISSLWPERFHFVLLTQLLCRHLDKKNTKTATLALTSIMKTCGISKTGFKILSLTGLIMPYSSWRSEIRKMLSEQRTYQRYYLITHPFILHFMNFVAIYMTTNDITDMNIYISGLLHRFLTSNGGTISPNFVHL